MPYVGGDWSDMSTGQKQALAIDFKPYLKNNAIAGGVTVEFYPVDGYVDNYAAILDGAAYIIAYADKITVNQSILRPPVGRYYLGFTCTDTAGNEIELWSFFKSKAPPPNAQ